MPFCDINKWNVSFVVYKKKPFENAGFPKCFALLIVAS